MKAHWRAAGGFALKHWPLTAFLLVAVILVMTPHALERFFVYYPIKELQGDPSAVGLAFQDVTTTTEDRVRLHGWFVPYRDSGLTLLIFHGNAGNISHRLPWIEMLHELRAHVMIIDYRGFGKSEGRPYEEGLYRDARAAYEWWKRERGGPGQKLVLVGESLGGAVAVDLATRVPVAGLILQSAFTSGWDMAKTLFPLGLLQPLLGIDFDSAAKIGRVACPKLIIHGDRDEIVPLRLGKTLYQLASEPKRYYEVPGSGHNDLIWVAGAEYIARLREFLQLIG